jgi:hypothetical protein
VPWVPRVVDVPVHIPANYSIPIHQLLWIAHVKHVDIGEYLTMVESQLKMFSLYERVRASPIFLYKRWRAS